MFHTLIMYGTFELAFLVLVLVLVCLGWIVIISFRDVMGAVRIALES
jgi:hypothetical protein